MPLPAGVSYDEGESAGARLFREREDRDKEKERLKKENEGKLVRDEWMIVPPENMGLLACEWPVTSGFATRLASPRSLVPPPRSYGLNQAQGSLVQHLSQDGYL